MKVPHRYCTKNIRWALMIACIFIAICAPYSVFAQDVNNSHTILLPSIHNGSVAQNDIPTEGGDIDAFAQELSSPTNGLFTTDGDGEPGVETAGLSTDDLSDCVSVIQGGAVLTENCLHLVREGNGYRFQYSSRTERIQRDDTPVFHQVSCRTLTNQRQRVENYTVIKRFTDHVEFGDQGSGFYVTPGSRQRGTKLLSAIIPADDNVYTRVCRHIVRHTARYVFETSVSVVAAKVLESPIVSAEASWAFFFHVQKGAIYSFEVHLYNGRKEHVAQITQYRRAECKEQRGNVPYVEGGNALQFPGDPKGAYLECTPVGGGNFLQFVREMLEADGYTNIEDISLNYRDPWAAADISLAAQPISDTHGTLAAHPDVTLQITNNDLASGSFPLQFLVPDINVLNQTDWGLSVGTNKFWVGQDVDNFLGFWGPRWANWSAFFAFLPSPEQFQEFANSAGDKLFFWHNDAHHFSAQSVESLGSPSDTDLRVTIGCDLDGENCVRMTLRTLLLDPSCLSG